MITVNKELPGGGQRAADGEGGIAGERGVLMVVTEIMRDDGVNARDRLKAAEMLGKHLGVFTEKSDAASAQESADALLAARRRAQDAK
jgi:hypothetical protein